MAKPAFASIATYVKQLSITFGVYQQARSVERFIRPSSKWRHNNEVIFFQSLLPRDCLCFDIGGNIGEKTEALLAAGMRVAAFEPNPDTLSEFSARLKGQEYTLIQAAFGSTPALGTLYASKTSALSSLNCQWDKGEKRPVYTPVITLDQAIQALGIPEFAKIDVEGWELEVLKGLSQPIPLLCFEYHLSDIESCQLCLQRIQEIGGILVNIVPAGASGFLLGAWLEIDKAIASFHSLTGGTKKPDYGEVYVASSSNHQAVLTSSSVHS